jgi:hypothetical protein
MTFARTVSLAVAGAALLAGGGLLRAPAAGAAPAGVRPPTLVVEGPVPVEPGTVVLVHQVCATRPAEASSPIWTRLTSFHLMGGGTGGVPEWESRGSVLPDAAPGDFPVTVVCDGVANDVRLEVGRVTTGDRVGPATGTGDPAPMGPGSPGASGASGASGGGQAAAHPAQAHPAPAPVVVPVTPTPSASHPGPGRANQPGSATGAPVPATSPGGEPSRSATPTTGTQPFTSPVRTAAAESTNRPVTLLAASGGLAALVAIGLVLVLRRRDPR